MTSAGILCCYTVKSTRILKNQTIHQHTDYTLSTLPGINSQQIVIVVGVMVMVHAFALHFLKLKSKNKLKEEKGQRLF